MQTNLQPKKQNRFSLTFKSLDEEVYLFSEYLNKQTQLLTGFPYYSKQVPGSFAINFIDDMDNEVSKGLDVLINDTFHLTLGLLDMFGNVIESFEFRNVSVSEILHSGVSIDMSDLSKVGSNSDNEDTWVIKTVYFDYLNVIHTLHK